ncbi:hypothetical protein ACFFJQ_06985 [Bacillus capparidis]|uniref:Uncharacterized protein n=1 Tax=Bacillus capparidis TaxID=1840411 RepID=A0ABS4D1M1_9BACI|nr:hypothetical protein [Bacillus capparidis]
MSIYDDEIPRDLEVNKVYTSLQIRDFLTKNDNILIITEDSWSSSDQKYKVVSRSEDFVHKRSNEFRHIVPNRKSRIYKIKRTY